MKPAQPPKQETSASAAAVVPGAEHPSGDRQDRSWWIVCLLVLGVAALIRFCFLTMVPLHHDEGVNGNFLISLYRDNNYQYDPQNYHGPSLYYFALIVTKIAGLFTHREGLTTFAIRFVPAIFGLGLVWLTLQLKRQVGKAGAIGAAVLIAISPGAVYFSRYFIHEILFIFFSLGIVVSLLYYRRTFKPLYLMLASASTALLVATKETSVITLAVLVLAYLCAAIFERVRFGSTSAKDLGKKRRSRVVRERTAAGMASEPLLLNWNKGVTLWKERVGGSRPWWNLISTAAVLFLVIHVCLYTSFFSRQPKVSDDDNKPVTFVQKAEARVEANLAGILDSVRTYETWTRTGTDQYKEAETKYLEWMSKAELGTLLLGAAGIAIALIRGRNRFGVFLAFYALGELAAYSLIPYKTPWLTLNILLPFWLVAGYAVQEIVEFTRRSSLERDRIGAWAGAAIILAGTGWQSIDLNFYHYDDNSLTYVYAHSQRSLEELVREVDRLVELNNLGPNVGITVMAPEYWPLPWYTRHYRNTGYYGRFTETNEPIIIGQDRQRAEIERSLGDKYDHIGTYTNRPGVILELYLRKDLTR